MKFGQNYRHYLDDAGFPPHWVESAISYNALKKCIRPLTQELKSLGLGADNLKSLLETAARDSEITADEDDGCNDLEGKYLRYELTKRTTTAQDGEPRSSACPVKPMLLFLVDDETGLPVDGRLAPETKDYIHQLALNEKLTDVRITRGGNESHNVSEERTSSDINNYPDETWSRRSSRAYRLVKVPLTTDSEFFTILQNELSEIVSLQDQEKKKLRSDITSIGRALATATNPTDRKRTHDLSQWRKLFELYLDSRVFFATNEQDHGAQDFSEARKRFSHFLQRAQKQRLLETFKKRESADALQQFLFINTQLLQNQRFHEINQTAMKKILKKFDKRTALGVKSIFPSRLPPSMIAQDIAKDLSAQVSTEIISVVPLLDDYLCPICSDISWRPIRLRCHHVYCIRCLIRLQRDGEDRCPMCREGVLMEADSANLDPALVNFLVRYFPDEVMAKQKLNEKLATIDQFGDEFVNAKCRVM